MGKRQGIMLATPFTERHFNQWMQTSRRYCAIARSAGLSEVGDSPFILGQYKLNGERMVWWPSTFGKMEVLMSSEQNLVSSVPHIEEELRNLFYDIPLDGEVYIHGWSRQSIHSIYSRTVDLHPEHEAAEFHVFDTPQRKMQCMRWLDLAEHPGFKRAKHVKLVPMQQVRTPDEASALVADAVANGYEGGIFRNPWQPYYEGRSVHYMMKWKPRHTDTYRIVMPLVGRGKYAGTLGALVVEDREGRVFTVGSFKITDQERHELWKNQAVLPGAFCTVEYIELTDGGVPPSGVFKCLVKGDAWDDFLDEQV